MASGGGKLASPKKKVLLDPTQYRVIHSLSEDGDDDSAPSLECQLEDTLEKGFELIVVEPPGLGENCIRWIRVGNFLHKSAVISAFGTLVVTPFIPRRAFLFSTLPLGVFGVCCAGLYGFSWQFDPCCKYQVDYRGRELTKIPSRDIHTSSPILLVRKNDKFRKLVHNTLSIAVIGYLSYIFYRHYNS